VNRNIEQLDRNIHEELQSVNVLIALMEDLSQRHPEGGEIRSTYLTALNVLQGLREKLQETDDPVYEVNAG